MWYGSLLVRLGEVGGVNIYSAVLLLGMLRLSGRARTGLVHSFPHSLACECSGSHVVHPIKYVVVECCFPPFALAVGLVPSKAENWM